MMERWEERGETSAPGDVEDRHLAAIVPIESRILPWEQAVIYAGDSDTVRVRSSLQ